MSKQELLDRLQEAHPGWDVYDRFLTLVESLDFESFELDHRGTFIASGIRLGFSEHDPQRFAWPQWLPRYVPALVGMQADDCEMAGGFADSFSGEQAQRGSVFCYPGEDLELGYPIIDVPADTYPFQNNSHGATFFLSRELDILYPNSKDLRFEVLDSLDNFTKANIEQVLIDKGWFAAYSDTVKGHLMD